MLTESDAKKLAAIFEDRGHSGSEVIAALRVLIRASFGPNVEVELKKFQKIS